MAECQNVRRRPGLRVNDSPLLVVLRSLDANFVNEVTIPVAVMNATRQ